jgi:uncharacterized protein YjcR
MSEVLARLLLKHLGITPQEIAEAESLDPALDARQQLLTDLHKQRATLETVTQNINRVLEGILAGSIEAKQANTLLYALQTQLGTVKAFNANLEKETKRRAATAKKPKPPKPKGHHDKKRP